MKKSRFWFPLIAAAAIVIVDQIAKALVVAHIPEGRIFFRIFGDFIWIVHARNTGAAFSLGASSSPMLRVFIFYRASDGDTDRPDGVLCARTGFEFSYAVGDGACPRRRHWESDRQNF